MNKRIVRNVVLAMALWPAAAHAGSGPWTMEPGKGRVIATAIYSHAGRSFDDEGDARPAPDYDQYQLYVLAEYGVTADLTVFANPNFGKVSIENGLESTGIGFVELGARHRLAERDGFILSAQASALIPGRERRTPVAQIGNTAMQYDLRLQGGYGFGTGFASAEAGYRFRNGIEPNEVHADLSLGVRAGERAQIIGNLFNVWSDGAGRDGYPSYRYSNAYLGLAYDVSERLTLQAGGLATVTGRNALRERGVFTGFWFRF